MKNYYLYIILWAGGCLIAATITLLWNDTDKPADSILFGNTTIEFGRTNTSSNIVAELLMSAKEFNISGMALVSPGYKVSNPDNPLLSKFDQKNNEQVYNAILKKKLEKATRQNPSKDFSIKPVPQKTDQKNSENN